MSDRSPPEESEVRARRDLVSAARAMLAGEVSFFEGAARVLRLIPSIGPLADRDPDFDAFVVIGSDTDHLPLEAERHLWNARALADLEPEFARVEEWARSFAPAACQALIARYDR